MTGGTDASSIHRIAPRRVFMMTFVWPMCCAGLVSFVFWHESSRLPDPIASHWSRSGPDGSMSRAAFFSLTVGVGALIATTALVVALATGHFAAERVAMVAGSAMATFYAGMALTSLWANRSAATWMDAKSLGAGSLGAVVVLAILTGGIAWRLAGSPPSPPPGHFPWESDPDTPTEWGVDTAAATATGDPVEWSGRCRVRWPLWLAAALAVIGGSAVLAVPDPFGRAWIGALCLVGVLACAAMSSVSMRVAPDGVTVRFSAVGLPVRRVAVDQILSAESIVLDPLQWGGWGYRWVPHRRATAMVLRRGDAVVLHLIGGRTLAVTVDDAGDCAAAVNALIRAHRTPR